MSHTWHRDKNAARNIGLRFLERLAGLEVPEPFRRSTESDSPAIPVSQHFEYTPEKNADTGRLGFERKLKKP